jgi:hypothetical protein
MQHNILIGLSLAVVTSLTTLPAAAQSNTGQDVRTASFDLWCQEEASLPLARCDARTVQDESRFEAHQVALEVYEIPYRSGQYAQGRLNRDIMNADPIDNPNNNNLGLQRQYPNISVTDSQSR